MYSDFSAFACLTEVGMYAVMSYLLGFRKEEENVFSFSKSGFTCEERISGSRKKDQGRVFTFLMAGWDGELSRER